MAIWRENCASKFEANKAVNDVGKSRLFPWPPKKIHWDVLRKSWDILILKHNQKSKSHASWTDWAKFRRIMSCIYILIFGYSTVSSVSISYQTSGLRPPDYNFFFLNNFLFCFFPVKFYIFFLWCRGDYYVDTIVLIFSSYMTYTVLRYIYILSFGYK
jgi:hypothetical protein